MNLDSTGRQLRLKDLIQMPSRPRSSPNLSPSNVRQAPHEADLAKETWAKMTALVHDNDPSGELRLTLGLGRGTGRVKTLLSLSSGALSLAELAQVVGVDPPYATLIANELQALGLLSRTPDPRDRRKKSVQLTATGRQAVRTANQIINRPPPAMRDMSSADLHHLHDLLERLSPSPEQ
jgi:DNA-binding MarR family transcriptional regulator